MFVNPGQKETKGLIWELVLTKRISVGLSMQELGTQLLSSSLSPRILLITSIALLGKQMWRITIHTDNYFSC